MVLSRWLCKICILEGSFSTRDFYFSIFLIMTGMKREYFKTEKSRYHQEIRDTKRESNKKRSSSYVEMKQI